MAIQRPLEVQVKRVHEVHVYSVNSSNERRPMDLQRSFLCRALFDCARFEPRVVPHW